MKSNPPPLVSVVLSVYSGERYLNSTIDSVLSQTLKEIELIVIDDGSNSKRITQILSDYEATDSRVVVIRKSNEGLTKALIEGCSQATAPYIARIDVGDSMLPDRLAKQLAVFRQHPDTSIVSTWTGYYTADWEFLWLATGEPFGVLANNQTAGSGGDISHHGAVMFNRSHYEKVGGYRWQFYYGQDWDLWYRLAQHGAHRLVPELLYKARVFPDSISMTQKQRQEKFASLSFRASTLNSVEAMDELLDEASKIRPTATRNSEKRYEPRGARRRAESAGNYFIGKLLIDQRHPAGSKYLKKAVVAKPWSVKYLVFYLRSLLIARRKMASKTNPAGFLNILIVADVDPDPNSGAAGTEYRTAEALRELGHEVEVIWRQDLVQWVGHANLHYLVELPFTYWFAIKKRVQQGDFDVVHINQPYSWFAAWRLRKIGFAGAVVNRSHGWEPNVHESLRPWSKQEQRSRYQKWKTDFALPMHWVLRSLYPKWSVEFADLTLVSSNHDRDYILKNYRISENRVAVLAQGINEQFLSGHAPLMTKKRSNRVLYVGQFAFVKAPNVLSEVINELANRMPELRFTWCCLSDHHHLVTEMLSSEARERTELVGWMPQEELVSLYDSHGIILFPSYYEGFGKAFIEAMSRGCVPVCTATGGMQDIITHRVNGMLSPVGDADAMVENVAALLESEGDLDRLSMQASIVARVYSWPNFATKLVKLYRGLLRSQDAY